MLFDENKERHLREDTGRQTLHRTFPPDVEGSLRSGWDGPGAVGEGRVGVSSVQPPRFISRSLRSRLPVGGPDTEEGVVCARACFVYEEPPPGKVFVRTSSSQLGGRHVPPVERKAIRFLSGPTRFSGLRFPYLQQETPPGRPWPLGPYRRVSHFPPRGPRSPLRLSYLFFCSLTEPYIPSFV